MSNSSGEELRKLQVTGGSTFIVSLPKTWVEQMGLQRGSVVKINQKDDMTLCLTPQGADAPDAQRKVIITPNPDDTPDSIVRRVVSAYLMGYNIIQLRSTQQRLDSAQKFQVKDFTRKKLVGTEIVRFTKRPHSSGSTQLRGALSKGRIKEDGDYLRIHAQRRNYCPRYGGYTPCT